METVFAVIGVIAVIFVLWSIFSNNNIQSNQDIGLKQTLVKQDIKIKLDDYNSRMTLLKEQTERLAWSMIKHHEQYNKNPIYEIDDLLDDEIRHNLENTEILSKNFNLPIQAVQDTIIVAIELVRLNYKNRIQ